MAEWSESRRGDLPALPFLSAGRKFSSRRKRDRGGGHQHPGKGPSRESLRPLLGTGAHGPFGTDSDSVEIVKRTCRLPATLPYIKNSCFAPVALTQLPTAFVIRAIALLTHTV